MRALSFAITIFISAAAFQAAAEPINICTILSDAKTGLPIRSEGDCDRRASPASTFKIVLSLIGFEAEYLQDAHHPSHPFVEGYVDWNPKWKTTTHPASWMRDSVVWYSQLMTTSVGKNVLSGYVSAFDYGNQDLSGDKGKNNGLTHSWLSSSLQISPKEQLQFIKRIIDRNLPVSDRAIEMTEVLLKQPAEYGGWTVYGKTGTGVPRGPEGSYLTDEPFGWFVGWAKNGDRSVMFVRLVQDSERPDVISGVTAKRGVLHDIFETSGWLR